MDLARGQIMFPTKLDASPNPTPQVAKATPGVVVVVPLFAVAALCMLTACAILIFVLWRWASSHNLDDSGRKKGESSSDINPNETSSTGNDVNDASAGFHILQVGEVHLHSNFSSSSLNVDTSKLQGRKLPPPLSAISAITTSFEELDDFDSVNVKDSPACTVLPTINKCHETRNGVQKGFTTPINANRGPSIDCAVRSNPVAMECRGESESVSSDRNSQAETRDMADQAEGFIATQDIMMPLHSTALPSPKNSISFQLSGGSALVRDIYVTLPTNGSGAIGMGLGIAGASSPDSFPSASFVQSDSPFHGRVFESDYIVRLNDTSTEGLDEEHVLHLMDQYGSALKMTIVTIDMDGMSDKPTNAYDGLDDANSTLEV